MKPTKKLCIVFFITISSVCFSQSISDSLVNDDYLKVYLDGVDFYQDYIKQNITFINYVRDRYDAQVHLLITQQQTGSGGTEFTLFYLGQLEFAGKNDTIKYVANSINTEDEIRTGLIQSMQMGLLSYVAKLPKPTAVKISFTAAASSTENRQQDDKWNGWIYSLSGNGNISIDNVYRFYNYGGGISAKKITEKWKINFSGGAYKNESRFVFGEEVGDTVFSENNSAYADAIVVKSLGDHWSVGFQSGYFSSTYSNYDHNIYFSPAVEYDIFPYGESESKLLSFFYKITPEYADYTDTTIYGKTTEFLFSHSLDVSLSLKKKWGSVSTGIGGSNYLNDFGKNKFNFFGSINWRIYEGLSINGFVGYDIIHDQVNIPKGEASDEDILLQQKELSKSYGMFTYFGISYSFGSIYNNVVNPRFETGNFSISF
ncbi:MAG: hypothetical protein H7Y00_10690 [Fimbriimonadaceae bacterium]|nr:hypothetical protein [Chitinophagales bacterium]